jgi:hypothetical protein
MCKAEGRCPHPSPLPEGEGADLHVFKPEFDWISQVDVLLENNTVGPLSLWERVRVREKNPPTVANAPANPDL